MKAFFKTVPVSMDWNIMIAFMNKLEIANEIEAP